MQSPPSYMDSQGSGDEASQAEPEPETEGTTKEEEAEEPNDDDVFEGKFAPGTKARENAFAGVCSNAKTLLNEKFDKDLTLTFPKDLSEPSGSTLLCSRARHPFVFLFRWFVDEHQPRNDMTMWIRTLSKECLHTLQDVQAAVQMPGNLLHYSVTVFVDSTTAANT